MALINRRSDLKRVPDAMDENNKKAGYKIYTSNNKLYIKNSNKLTLYERYAILMSHTGNVTFNSFAAEVKFHSDALKEYWSNIPKYYNAAVRADMAIGEEYESGFFDKYYDLNSSIVKEQIKYHGEK